MGIYVWVMRSGKVQQGTGYMYMYSTVERAGQDRTERDAYSIRHTEVYGIDAMCRFLKRDPRTLHSKQEVASSMSKPRANRRRRAGCIQ